MARERAGHAAWAFWIFLHPWLFAPPCLPSQPLLGHASTLGDSPPPRTPRPCLAPRTLRHATPCKRREEGGWVLWGRRRRRGRDVDCGGEDGGRLWGRWTIEVGFSILGVKMGCWAAPQLTKALLRVLPWKMTSILRGRPLPTTLIDLQRWGASKNGWSPSVNKMACLLKLVLC